MQLRLLGNGVTQHVLHSRFYFVFSTLTITFYSTFSDREFYQYSSDTIRTKASSCGIDFHVSNTSMLRI